MCRRGSESHQTSRLRVWTLSRPPGDPNGKEISHPLKPPGSTGVRGIYYYEKSGDPGLGIEISWGFSNPIPDYCMDDLSLSDYSAETSAQLT